MSSRKNSKSSSTKEESRKTQVQSQTAIDNESLEFILVGHAIAITAEAGQIYRELGRDHGIDGEIEFKDDHGRATASKLYVQLKSGDSHLIKHGDNEIFKIKKERWATYWQEHAYPVMLVIRTSDGESRWMEVSSYLKKSPKPVKEIVFDGERFDVMSVRRWRDKMLGGYQI